MNYTCKIPIVGVDSLCILNSEWLSTEINLLLLHDNQAWSGKFQLVENEDITELLDQLSLSRDAYLEETRSALTTHGGAENFAYGLDNDKFTWKKYVRKNMSVKFGNVNLIQVPLFEAFEKVIDNTIKSNLNSSTKLQNSDKLRENLEKENNTLKTKLNGLVDQKNEMEKTLYSQFLHLLNEKKKKIKELKNKIPIKENEDIIQSESDHFDSDTDIDSEEEEKPSVPFESSMDADEEPINIPKRSRQKRQIESIAGPSGKNSKPKNLKAVQPKKQTVNGKKGQGKSVLGQNPKNKDKSLTEVSEDAFIFPKRTKRTIESVKLVKPTTSKIKYESDEDTDLSKDGTLDCDIDKTLSQIKPESINGDVDLEPIEQNKNKSKSIKQKTGNQNSENNVIINEPKKEFGNSDVTKTVYRGLSTSTLEILNQLV